MDSDFLRQVIDFKKKLRQQEHDLHIQKAKIDDDLPYAIDDRVRELQIERLEIESKQLHTQRHLVRAQLFGLRYAKGPGFHCIFCFVEHDVLPGMKEVQPKILGARLAKCNRCDQELVLND